MKWYQVTSLTFLFLLLNWPVYSSEGAIRSREMLFSGADFAQGTGENIRVTADGLTLANGQSSGQYNSPILTAAIPFNVLVPEWAADLPAGGSLTIWLRTANREGVWSDWYELHESHDMILPEDTTVIGDFMAVPAVDATHTRFQFSVALNRLTDEAPLLYWLNFTLIDSTGGPTLEEMIAQQETLNASQPEPRNPDLYPKPFVVSRAVWCTDPACNYTGMQYAPVTHLIVHHTATSNSSSNWTDTMRAIWHFHTFTRGWGDIGYNYLVDPNGVLYEGRLGGDDVVGTHATGANAGTMALSFIGHFTSYNPPSPMFNSAANLLAWKADQKGIDVYNASRLPNLSWGLPHLMGHRDVYGNTECPGERLHETLPWLKNEVANRIGFTSPYVYIDELSNAFSKSAANWYSTDVGCGFNRHAYYTWSTTDPSQSTNWGEWRLNVPVDGRYEISVYAPYCITGRAETHGARYTIYHAGGSNVRTVSHENNVGVWMTLGDFDFIAGQDNRVRLTDLTATDSGLGVWFDAIRWRASVDIPVMTVTNAQPANLTAHSTRAINFSWQRANNVAVSAVQLQVAAAPDFSHLILAANLPADANNHSHTFSQDYPDLYWRIKMNTYLHGVVWSTPTQFAIDTEPPTSAVYGVYELSNNRFVIAWSGDGTGSAITGYNIDYRPEGGGTWTRWLTNSSVTAALFTPPIGNGHDPVYWFRSQAIDAAGNVEPPHANPGDTHTGAAVFLEDRAWLPIIRR
jgi:hypothetical protein